MIITMSILTIIMLMEPFLEFVVDENGEIN